MIDFRFIVLSARQWPCTALAKLQTKIVQAIYSQALYPSINFDYSKKLYCAYYTCFKQSFKCIFHIYSIRSRHYLPQISKEISGSYQAASFRLYFSLQPVSDRILDFFERYNSLLLTYHRSDSIYKQKGKTSLSILPPSYHGRILFTVFSSQFRVPGMAIKVCPEKNRGRSIA